VVNNFPDDDQTQSFTVLTKGTKVLQYSIIQRLGAGGMGEVYLAEDVKLRRLVALKFMPAHLASDEHFKSRFAREAQATAILDHPNIVTIHDVGEYQGRPFFAMQHVDGPSLREYCAERDLTFDEIIELTLQICEGLRKAHDAGIVHRDVKPTNIMIGSDGRPVLLDFGLATIEGEDKLTKTGSTMGTLGYMSPEQVQSPKDVDGRSDLFSLGVVLYEMIAGQTPFKGDTQASSLHAITHDAPEPLARFKSGVPDELQRIVSKLLEKDPELRYQNAAGVISDLKRMAVTGKIKPVSSTPFYQWWRRLAWGGLVLVVIVAVGLGIRFLISSGGQEDDGQMMLAVLPFVNQGAPEDEFFADGVTEEILTNLARLSGLGVISRSSSIKYKNSDKNIKKIARELGVDYILEGTIRWDKSGETNRVRINPRLIRVDDLVNLWADRFDAVINDIFTVQTSIAERVVQKLNVALSESEQQAIQQRPTDNPEAYDYYLRGNQYVSSSEKDLRNAEEMYRQAIATEPDFALAYARLGFVHTQMYWWHHDTSPERLAAAKQAIDRALEISPNLADAQFGLAWYYYHGERDYHRALEMLITARKGQPNNSRLIMAIGLVQRRQGKWLEAVANMERAIELDPRDADKANELAGTLISVRRYSEAETLVDRAITLAPDHQWAHNQKILLYLLWDGNTTRARRALQDALAACDRWPYLTYLEITLDEIDGDYEHALTLLPAPGSAYVIAGTDTAEYYCIKADLYHRCQPELKTTYCDSARILLERTVDSTPDEPYFRIFLSRVYAGMGRKDDAIREGRKAVELFPISADAFSATDVVGALAEIYSMVGEYDLAIEHLDYLLSIPSWISVPYIRILPEFAPLRDHPRFVEMIETHSSTD
jgi:TolB-like protein/predicted Ser/Thr protein kinase